MDPGTLTADQWLQIGVALNFLWGALAAALFAALSLFTAHAIIPSAVATNSISARAASFRKILYGAGVIGVAVWLICLVLAVVNMGWIQSIFPRFWQ